MSSLVVDSSSDSDMEDHAHAEPICGPKSWKENKENFKVDNELEQIYEGREGDFPEGFGRVDGVSTLLQEPHHTPTNFGAYPITNHSNLDLNMNSYIERNTIKIPKIGPGKPERLSLGHTDSMETVFNQNEPEHIRYASGGNIPRSIAIGLQQNKCGICGRGYCQEQAGKQWYPIFTNWEFCHQNCWFKFCEYYHNDLEESGLENTTLNFIWFWTKPLEYQINV